MKIVFLLFLFFIMAFSFSKAWGQVDDFRCLQKRIGYVYGINDSLLAIWRSDSAGCLNQRISLVEELFKEEVLIGIPKKAFLLLYGNPTNISSDGIYTYIAKAYCLSSQPFSKQSTVLEILILFVNEKVSYIGKLHTD